MRLSLLILFNFVFFCATARVTVIPQSIYDFKVDAHKGGTIDLAQYKGKKILIVNTTARDEYSRQYEQLEALSKQYKDKLVVIGFLIEDFAIEPGTKLTPINPNKDYYVSFPLTTIVNVKGPDQTPVYQWLTQKKYNHLEDSEVKWDFQKYLIDEKGNLVAIFDPKIKANNPKLIAAIEKQ
ncbi:MAG: glutathione peroxidase [Flavipsychrobacter sp.]|nr:glutathione peroxidase [Flavipsychrobacter sp.]